MAFSLDVDLELTRGENFEKVFRVFSDERVKRWRGFYREHFLYKVGDGVQKAGEAWVALLQVKDSEPGGTGSSMFWSPLQVLNLTGYTAKTVADPEAKWGGFTTAAPLDIATGRLTIQVAKALFTTASVDSAHFNVELTSPLGVVTYPIKGTMLFGTP